MVGNVGGPSPQHLREMARVFPGGQPHVGEDATPDGSHRVSSDGRRIAYDGRTIMDTSAAADVYRPSSPDAPAPVTVSPDGSFVLFAVPDPSLLVHGAPRTLILQMQKTGLLFKTFCTEPVLCFDLDGPAASLDISPVDRSLAIAHENTVAEVSVGQQTRLRVQVPETLADVEYLSDGSLALCTEPQGDGRHFYYVAPDSSQPVPVSLRDFDPQALRQQQRHDLEWAHLGDAEIEAFQDKNPLLFNPNGSVVPYAWMASPADANQVVVLVPGQVIQARLYDASSRESRELGHLEGVPLQNLAVAWEPDGRMLAAWDQKVPLTSLSAWDTGSSQAVTLPEVSDVRYDSRSGEVSFVPPSEDGTGRGTPVKAKLADLATVAQEKWCQDALARCAKRLQEKLMQSAPAETATDPGVVEVDGAYINVNGVRVPRHIA